MLKINSPIPRFSVKDDEGKIFTQDNLKYQLSVLFFYMKDNTLGCTKEAIEFNRLYKDFADYDTKLIGISKDGVTTHKKFKEKHNLKHLILLSDPNLELHKAFGAYGVKLYHGKPTKGVLRTTFIVSSDLRVIYVISNVVVKGHAEFVLEKVKELVNS